MSRNSTVILLLTACLSLAGCGGVPASPSGDTPENSPITKEAPAQTNKLLGEQFPYQNAVRVLRLEDSIFQMGLQFSDFTPSRDLVRYHVEQAKKYLDASRDVYVQSGTHYMDDCVQRSSAMMDMAESELTYARDLMKLK